MSASAHSILSSFRHMLNSGVVRVGPFYIGYCVSYVGIFTLAIRCNVHALILDPKKFVISKS